MTLNSFNSLCDDFYADMYINTELDLPTQRDTILAFFERIQKQYPTMGCFYRHQNDEYCLEEDRRLGQYRWVALEIDRVSSGVVNPADLEIAYSQHHLILDLVPYMLGINRLDIDSLDIAFAMDFDFFGNHDEIIAEALFGSSAFNCLSDLPDAKAVGFSPSMVVALSQDQCTQARISVESKTSVYEPDQAYSAIGYEGGKHNEPDQAISLSLTIRQYRKNSQIFDPFASFEYQCRIAEEIMAEKIVPNFVKPLTETIAQRRST
jgi:hypothetical protein